MKSADLERSPPRDMRHVILRMMTTHSRAGVSDPEVPQWQEVPCDHRSRRRMKLSPVGVRQCPVRPGPCHSQLEALRLQIIDPQQLSGVWEWLQWVDSGLYCSSSVFCVLFQIIWYLVSPWARGMIWCSQPGSSTRLSLSSSGRLNYTSPHSGWPSSAVSK